MCVPTPGRVPRGRRAGAGPMATGSRRGHILLYQYRCGASTRVGRWGGCGPAWWGGAGCCQLGLELLSQAPGLPLPTSCCSKSLGSTRRAGSSGGCLLQSSELPDCSQWLLPVRCPTVRLAAACLPLTPP